MSVTKPRSDAQVIEALRREQAVLDLRIAGKTYREIAPLVGYTDPSAARQAFVRAKERLLDQTRETAEEYRALLLERYEADLSAIEVKRVEGDLEAIRVHVLVTKAIRELLGSDAPTKFTADTTVHIKISGGDDV